MKCPRCRVPVESDETQCTVCGEVLKYSKERPKPEPPPTEEINTVEELGLKFEISPSLAKIGIVWMVSCVLFAIVAIGVAFQASSIEAMWASFVAAGLAALPIIYVIMGRSVEVAYWFRKELTMLCGLGGAIFCVYLLSKAITKSQIQVETSGMQEMVTNENFTKTLITGIICVSLIAVMLPIAKMLMKSSSVKTFTDRYEMDSRQDMHTRESENMTSLELRKLELSHEVELRKLELERQRLEMEAERMQLLSVDPQLLLAMKTSGDSSYTNAAPPPPPPPPPSINPGSGS